VSSDSDKPNAEGVKNFPPMRKLEACAKQAKARREEQAKAKVLASAAVTTVESSQPKSKPPRRPERGRCRTSLIEEAQLDLFQLERQGRFTSLPVRPESEYPTFLTRLPIFRPCKRTNQRELLDNDNAMPFSTPWGEGRKHGPPLTIYDEDTLIAIGRLRNNRLIGQPGRLPVPVSDLYLRQGNPHVNVHVVQCMLSDIQEMCESVRGGAADRMRLDSIKRLAAVTIEFDTKTAAKFVGTGTTVKLVDVLWQRYTEDAILYIQFTPLMAVWYESEYTYLAWDVRRKLSDTGKAVHRFLSSQPKHYEISTKKLMCTIGYLRDHNKFLADLRLAMKQLEADGWVLSWEVEGTGRLTPHKLRLLRR
jgi:hypothetical protein